jgi:lysophospholipase L1-like esterase
MLRRYPRLGRFIGFAVIVGIWTCLLGLLGYFAFTFAIYADLKSPDHSRLTANNYGGFLAVHLYRTRFAPWWPGDHGGESDPELVFVPKPGVSMFHEPYADVLVTITPERMRAQPAYSPDEAHSRLVVMMGDSVTFGLGVSDNETFSALLQTRYHRHTINTGVPSYATARELIRLRRAGLLAKASVLVIQFHVNDTEENRFFLEHGDHFVMPQTEAIWQMMTAYRPLRLSYGQVIGGVTSYLHERLRKVGVRGLGREIIVRYSHHGRLASPSGGDAMATDFIAVLDRFPELTDKQIIVTEMPENGISTGFLEALRTKCGNRPNIHPVSLQLGPDDFFRYHVHLNAKGHQKVAAQLDRALSALDESAVARK